MQIKTKVLRKIVSVEFPDGVDYRKLAKSVGVHDATAYQWMRTGSVPDRYIPLIRDTPFEAVKKEKV